MDTPAEPTRRDHYKQDRKKPFLQAFRRYGAIAEASRVAGIDRATVHRWRKHDPEFSSAFDEANTDVTDDLEQCAIKRAKSKSDVLLIFLLKNRAPEKYGDNKWKQVVEEMADIMTSKYVSAIRRNVPDYCPSCKTHLDATRKVAEEIGRIAEEMDP